MPLRTAGAERRDGAALALMRPSFALSGARRVGDTELEKL